MSGHWQLVIRVMTLAGERQDYVRSDVRSATPVSVYISGRTMSGQMSGQRHQYHISGISAAGTIRVIASSAPRRGREMSGQFKVVLCVANESWIMVIIECRLFLISANASKPAERVRKSYSCTHMHTFSSQEKYIMLLSYVFEYRITLQSDFNTTGIIND